jgi:nitrogen fixation/metabolism regulation signal transduction histidine kinase
VQSIFIELTDKLEFEQDLQSWNSDDDLNLELLLQRLSNVFYTDINLYDEQGWLLASSRPEIFDLGLIGRHLNAVAFIEMITNQRSEFIHNETIGKLNYLSAYIPFVNSENKLLAYLNLPYFTRQDELTMEIANLVVTIINILVLLTVLSLTFAVIISNKITQPLRLIQQHISRFSLNQHNEKIRYKGKDEIGSLIHEYNLMIDQLTESAERLARSEREMAWREMAKQIAHEIKNPLTPMRLILQHLQRSWKEDPEVREQQQEKLSKIAGEFSNFAKMPLARNEKMDLTSVVKDVARLFGKTENIKITVKVNTTEKLYIWADKEQISRVFINLIKNAIQSIPEGKNGIVEILIDKTESKAIVKVKDNGKGISEEIRDKLFQPNFTTKTSGMGMGLAIAKNIITTGGGEIFYETELNKGSIFVVELPLLID